jgi:hypothetical protein
MLRVIAILKQGGHTYKDNKIVLLCHVNEQCHISDGEWFGYVRNESVHNPFILQEGKRFFYGDVEHSFQPTNIGSRPIVVGSYFTLRNSPSDTEISEIIYEITSTHAL